MSEGDVNVLANLRQVVEDAVVPPERETFSAIRYPYTYAADFLRAHPDVVPEHIRAKVGPINSRATAGRARQMWADEMGVSDHSAAGVLAEGFLVEHAVVNVPSTITKFWRREWRRHV